MPKELVIDILSTIDMVYFSDIIKDAIVFGWVYDIKYNIIVFYICFICDLYLFYMCFILVEDKEQESCFGFRAQKADINLKI